MFISNCVMAFKEFKFKKEGSSDLKKEWKWGWCSFFVHVYMRVSFLK